MIANPMEIDNYITKTKNGISIFAINSSLTPCDTNIISDMAKRGKSDKLTPLSAFSPFSAYQMTIIYNGTSCTANIEPKEIPALVKKAEFYFEKNLAIEFANKASCKYACQSITFKFGINKGMTPAAVLLEKGDQALMDEMTNLQNNMQKYPQNQNIKNACQEALTLRSQGRLNTTAKTVSGEYSVYDADWRPRLYKKTKEVNGVEYFSGYRCDIKYIPSDQNPFQVTIENIEAPVRKNPDKTVNILISQALQGSKKAHQMHIPADVFYRIAENLKEDRKNFKQAFYYNQYLIAKDIERQKKENARTGT